MAQVRIKVGASVDASLKDALRPLEEAARRAYRTVMTEAERAARDSTKATETEARRKQRIIENSATMAGKIAAKMAAEEIREREKAASAVERLEDRKTRMYEREAQRRMRMMERQMSQDLRSMERSAGKQWRFGEDRRQARGAAFGGALVSTSRTALRMAGRVAGSAARGAGVDLDFASHAQRNVDLEKRATDLSAAGYMVGAKGPAGIRQDPNEIINQVRGVANATAFDPEKAIEGLQSFVAKTGDLQNGRDILKSMAVLAKATGSELEHVTDAAGDVANALGDVPNKAQKIESIMRALAGQGKIGAVEMKDLSKQMAGLGAASTRFVGDPTKLMAEMGAMAQMARAGGGSKSATQAVTSVQSFAATFSKGARLDAFANMGVAVNDANGKRRDPLEIMKDAMKAAGSKEHGGMANFDRNMGKMFMDVRARGATLGFEKSFVNAGGGDKGIAAVQNEIDKLMKIAMGEGEIMESFNRAMRTTASQSQVVNNQLSEAASQFQSAINPALLDLAPAAIGAAKAFSEAAAVLLGSKALLAGRTQAGHNIETGNAISDAGAIIRSGTATPEEIEHAKSALAAAKEKADKDAASLDATGAGRSLYGKKGNTAARYGIRALDAVTGGSAMGRMMGLKNGVLENMTEAALQNQTNAGQARGYAQDSSKQLADAIKSLDEALRTGKIVVKKEPAPPTVASDGRTPGVALPGG